MGFSNLKDDLYKKKCIDTNICSCGNEREDAKHFLTVCPQYDVMRNTMINSIHSFCNVRITYKVLLFGKDSLSDDVNMQIFQHVYQFIIDSKRF